ncbi:MAG: hypothetical protein ACYC8T_37810, partial [Myxococcaceae bacterium]
MDVVPEEDGGSAAVIGIEEDAGADAGDAGDAGVDAGDAGPPDSGPVFGGPGPWPLTNRSYGLEHGILESPVVGTSTDETQNLWVATHEALYLLEPGQTRFRRYDADDGLHLQGNPVTYCDKDLYGG